MAVPKFRENSIIREFNGLKHLFRDCETKVSKQRIADLMFASREARSNGRDLAFDVLGSVCFGQAQSYSDTDIVIYTRCTSCPDDCDVLSCPEVIDFQNKFSGIIRSSYPLQIIDCLNLNTLERVLRERDVSDGTLIRFGFYRSICKCVNGRLLRRYETQLSQDNILCEQIETSLIGCFFGLIHSSAHTYSFRKYVERMEAEGYHITVSMADKIREYLSH